MEVENITQKYFFGLSGIRKLNPIQKKSILAALVRNEKD